MVQPPTGSGAEQVQVEGGWEQGRTSRCAAVDTQLGPSSLISQHPGGNH